MIRRHIELQPTLPVAGGGLDVGTWQGIYPSEHRDHGGVRTITATIHD